MPHVSELVRIERPAEEVFEFVTTPENDRQWMGTAVERRPEPEGPLHPGARVQAVDRFLGRRIESTFVVIEHEPNARSAIRLEGPIAAEGVYELRSINGGTLFHWTLDAKAGLGGLFLGRFTDPLVILLFRRRMRFDLRRLKQTLESRPSV
jgi:Polyketide cyclase / dehydrase and lipid transport